MGAKGWAEVGSSTCVAAPMYRAGGQDNLCCQPQVLIAWMQVFVQHRRKYILVFRVLKHKLASESHSEAEQVLAAIVRVCVCVCCVTTSRGERLQWQEAVFLISASTLPIAQS